MKKIEIVERWLHQNMGLLRCPVCQSSFKNIDQHQLQCVNNHRININKHGYVYFLNRGVKSEYNQDMHEARRAILNAGLFNGILDRINQLMPDQPQKFWMLVLERGLHWLACKRFGNAKRIPI